ncbi:MAG: hypothetical protein PVS3B1_18240 [Ktedonobacteraceae bacterium]
MEREIEGQERSPEAIEEGKGTQDSERAGIAGERGSDAIAGKRIYKATAGKIANALSKGLGTEITYKGIEGLNLAD